MHPSSFHNSGRPVAPRTFWPLLLAVGLVGCAEGSLQPEQSASVSLSMAVSAEGAMTGATLDGVAFADGHHVLSLQSVSLVVGGVTLREEGVAVCPAAPLAAVGCHVLERGLVLLEAPLDGSVRSLVAALVRPARYGALGLRLHAPNRADAMDSTFLALHEGFEGTSLRVEGLWDGEPFTFERTLDEERWVELRPMVVESGRTANVTLRLDPSSWFRSEDGRLVDPRIVALDPVAAAGVDSRIRTSIAAFEDDDVDGVADSG
jgi:hypothetical protein